MSGENELRPSSWTVDTLHTYVDRVITDMRTMLDERYATQVKAVDAAFLAQQTAMQTALAAAERAVATALLSAEKAVTKAEVAQEKRLEAVNEFRAQLSDQAATFVRREEVDVRINAIDGKLDSEAARLVERIRSIENRIDLTQGEHSGANNNRNVAVQMTGVALVVVSVVVAIVAVILK